MLLHITQIFLFPESKSVANHIDHGLVNHVHVNAVGTSPAPSVLVAPSIVLVAPSIVSSLPGHPASVAPSLAASDTNHTIVAPSLNYGSMAPSPVTSLSQSSAVVTPSSASHATNAAPPDNVALHNGPSSNSVTQSTAIANSQYNNKVSRNTHHGNWVLGIFSFYLFMFIDIPRFFGHL